MPSEPHLVVSPVSRSHNHAKRVSVELKVCTLFLLSALVCSGTVAIEERRGDLQTAVTFGVSGVKCTRDGRRCVTGARCVNRKCQCPSGKKGNAELDCVEQREQLCYISGKANIIAFGGSDATLNFPCSYRATRFVIPARTSSSGPTSCSVEVLATNELHIDSYRVSRLRVSVGLVQPALQMQSNQEVTADGVYGIQTNQTKKQYTYHVNVGPMKINAWGSSNLQTASIGDLISFNVDSVNNFVVLNIPTCGARIKFRAYDVTSDFQEQVPGIAIMAPSEANFIQSDGSHLSALCGRSTDNAALYKNHASYLGLPNPSVAALYDILEDGTLQTDNPAASRCERAVRLFAASRDKKVDVRECSFLVLNSRVHSCLVRVNLYPMDVFNACLSFRQQPISSPACFLMRQAANACPNGWNGPRNYPC